MLKIENFESQISLDLAKQYLRVSDESENSLIKLLICCVEEFVENFTVKRIEKSTPIPNDLKLAMLDHLAFIYDNRGVAETTLPPRILQVYNMHKNLSI